MKKALSCQTPAREGSPTALRGAPEAWWAGAAPRPFGGSQSGGRWKTAICVLAKHK